MMLKVKITQLIEANPDLKQMLELVDKNILVIIIM